MKYSIRFSSQALRDIAALYKYIAEDLFAPITADRYVDGIYNVIRKLIWLGNSFAVSQNNSLRTLYGTKVRTIRYKKTTIVYNIANNTVQILRIMPGSMIH